MTFSFKLHHKINAAILITFISIAIIFSSILFPFQQQRLQTVMDKVETLLRTLVERDQARLANAIFAERFRAIELRLQEMLQVHGLLGIGIFDTSGEILVSEGRYPPSSPLPPADQERAGQHIQIRQIRWQGQSTLLYLQEIQVIGERIGFIQMYYSLADVEREQRLSFFMSGSLLGSILLLMLVLLNMILSKTVIHPITHLRDAMQDIHEGKLGGQVDIQRQDEIGDLSDTFNHMSVELAETQHDLKKLNEELEQLVEQRTAQLSEANRDIKKKNRHITDSILYARRIQEALFPNIEEVKSLLPRSFLLWKPRDIVGGDFIFSERFAGGLLLAVVDCTGHGVPGAFMTMIALSALRKIVLDEGCHEPALILQRLNRLVQRILHQDQDEVASNDGMDAAIVKIHFSDVDGPSMTFSGANLPLVSVDQTGVSMIKGDQQSLGYKDAHVDFQFTSHSLALQPDMACYLFSDGYKDQIREHDGRRFGIKRFRELLKTISGEPFDRQADLLEQHFDAFKGKRPVQDDVTVVGFRVRPNDEPVNDNLTEHQSAGRESYE